MWDLSTTTASNVIAVTLGALSLIFGVLLPAVGRWRRERRAELEIRFEKFWRLDVRERQGGLAHRIVIKNHGPASARHVELPKVVDEEGTEVNLDDQAVSPLPPVSQLLPGQEFHIIVEKHYGEYDPATVTARWRDQTGVRSAEFVVSPHFVS